MQNTFTPKLEDWSTWSCGKIGRISKMILNVTIRKTQKASQRETWRPTTPNVWGQETPLRCDDDHWIEDKSAMLFLQSKEVRRASANFKLNGSTNFDQSWRLPKASSFSMKETGRATRNLGGKKYKLKSSQRWIICEQKYPGVTAWKVQSWLSKA